MTLSAYFMSKSVFDVQGCLGARKEGNPMGFVIKLTYLLCIV